MDTVGVVVGLISRYSVVVGLLKLLVLVLGLVLVEVVVVLVVVADGRLVVVVVVVVADGRLEVDVDVVVVSTSGTVYFMYSNSVVDEGGTNLVQLLSYRGSTSSTGGVRKMRVGSVEGSDVT